MARTIMECWDVLHNPMKWENLDIITSGGDLGSRIYEYLTGIQYTYGSNRGQTGHQFGQANIDAWTAKNNKIRNDSTVTTQSIRDSLQ